MQVTGRLTPGPVARHVDAGYEEAAETARTKGVKVPMLGESSKQILL